MQLANQKPRPWEPQAFEGVVLPVSPEPYPTRPEDELIFLIRPIRGHMNFGTVYGFTQECVRYTLQVVRFRMPNIELNSEEGRRIWAAGDTLWGDMRGVTREVAATIVRVTQVAETQAAGIRATRGEHVSDQRE